MKKVYLSLKHSLDLAAAFILLLLLWPLMLVIAILIKRGDGGRVFYVQKRPGYKGKPFYIYKFRTMSEKSHRVTKDGRTKRIADSERITPIGSFLRKTSLDELPQLFNVIAGEMSFIGPRPLLMRYLGRYSKEQMRRHDVRPGISGLAQVMGRNSIDWDEKFRLDVWYVDNIGMALDISILFLTVKNVVSRKGINNSESETMPFFKGDGKS